MCNFLLSSLFSVVLATTLVVLPAAGQLGRGKTATAPAPAAQAPAAPAAPAEEQPATQEPAAVPHLTVEQVRKIVGEESEGWASAAVVKNLTTRIDALESQTPWIIYGWLFALTVGLVAFFVAAVWANKEDSTPPPTMTTTPAAAADTHPQTRMVRRDETQHGFGRIGFLITLVVIGLVFFAVSAAAAPTCWNKATGVTPGSQKVAVAIVGADNTFVCSISGKAVELVDPDTPATVVLTPTVGKNSLLEFSFRPVDEGRLLIKIDGKVYNQLAIRSQAIAEGINDAIDLVGPAPSGASSGVDTHVRLLFEGMACPTGDASCLAAFRRQAWGSGRGTSAQAGAAIHAGIVNTTLGDPRLKEAFGNALTAFARNLPAVPAAVDLTAVNDRLDKVEAGQADLGRRVDAVAATAANAQADAVAAQSAAFSAQQTATELRQLLARKGSRGIKNALKTPPPATAAPAPPERKKGPAFTKAEK